MFKWLKEELIYWNSVRKAKRNSRLMKYFASYEKSRLEIQNAEKNNKYLDAMIESYLKPAPTHDFNIITPFQQQLLDILSKNGKSKSKGKRDSKESSASTEHKC